ALDGTVLARQTLALDDSPIRAQLDRMAQTLSAQAERLNLDKGRLLGVGISAPGPLDACKGLLLAPPNFDAWHHVPIADELSARTGWTARLENVSNALALETRYFGLGRGLDSFMALQVNEGIGAGIVLGGQLYRGAFGLGGEIGHTSIAWDGLPCECGHVGCLEKYAAIPALLNGSSYANWSALMDALPHAEDARTLLRREAAYLAAGIVNVLNLLDLDQVVLLGDLCDRPEPLLEALNGLVRERLIARDTRKKAPVCCENLVSGVRSAAMAHIHAFYQVDG
ncbi:MAG TPA: ROK family protein, partial [Clostridia bacterium]|nr:ROK family protein [Clostridia bacterium]